MLGHCVEQHSTEWITHAQQICVPMPWHEGWATKYRRRGGGQDGPQAHVFIPCAGALILIGNYLWIDITGRRPQAPPWFSCAGLEESSIQAVGSGTHTGHAHSGGTHALSCASGAASSPSGAASSPPGANAPSSGCTSLRFKPSATHAQGWRHSAQRGPLRAHALQRGPTRALGTCAP